MSPITDDENPIYLRPRRLIMSARINLRELERKAWRSVFQDGLWDVFIGCIVLQLAITPMLSRRLGDFWSSVVFLPFWVLVYLVIWAVRRYVVTPLSGMVKFGPSRRVRLLKFNLVTFVVLLVGLILGVLSALNRGVPGWIHTARFGLIILLGFSVAAYFLDFTRLYLYGVLVALSPLVGEWLWVRIRVPHHGFPVTFGITAGIIILTGLVQFGRFLRRCALPVIPAEEGISDSC